MRLVTVSYSDTDSDINLVKDIQAQLPPVVFGFAIHPTSELLAMTVLGVQHLVCVPDGPMYFPQGISRDYIAGVRRITWAAGKLVLAVAEDPSEMGLLPNLPRRSNRRGKATTLRGTSGYGTTLYLDMPRGRGASAGQFYIPFMPTPPAGGPFTWQVDVYGILTVPAGSALGGFFGGPLEVVDIGVTASPATGATVRQSFDIPAGFEALSFVVQCTGDGGVPDATENDLDVFLAVDCP